MIESHPQPRSVPNAHLMTVVLEDYFQVAPLNSVIQTNRWYRFESRVEANTSKALDLLDEFGIKATFFVLGWIADEMPELVHEVVRRGHEVASKGYVHRSIRGRDAEEFRDDLVRSREALEPAGVKLQIEPDHAAIIHVGDGQRGPNAERSTRSSSQEAHS
jgi:peptidoglycan/xylan/chitin deacetylase (PgdA/CDA1 family)